MLNLLRHHGVAYDQACQLIELGEFERSNTILSDLRQLPLPPNELAIVENDLAVLELLATQNFGAAHRFEPAMELDCTCEVARRNQDWISTRDGTGQHENTSRSSRPTAAGRRVKVAILSLLFNWPSTGGGTVHTAETGHFLQQCGYDVGHWYAKFPGWNLGNVDEAPLLPATHAIEFNETNWSSDEIVRRFRQALDGFHPDYVIITDSWNSKPILAEAARGYKFFLRLAAQECLCPLNNVRLLVDLQGRATACPRQQLATSHDCRRCVSANEHRSGWLHHQERSLAGFGTDDYDARLRRAFSDAEGILVVNPIIAANVAPFANAVHVIPSGFDTTRFPWHEPDMAEVSGPIQILFAGLVTEYMKGFHVLLDACEELWSRRQDFEIVVTCDPADGPELPFLRYIGWQSQADLPRKLRDAAILVFPTIAEEALGRTAVEAMGVGRPVVASRIGGLPFTVTDELTGLLFEPGNSKDLAAKLERLMDSPELRRSLGLAGRRKFEREYTWEIIVDKYQALFGQPVVSVRS